MKRSGIHPHSSAARILALVLLVAGWGIPLAFPHLADDDLLCVAGDPPLEGDGPHVTASPSGPAADHCAVCHLQRSFRSGDLAACPGGAALDSAPLRLAARQPHPPQPDVNLLPARAPPA